MITEPKIVERAAQPYAAIRTQVTIDEMRNGLIPAAIGEVATWLGQRGIAPTGAPFIRYHVINMAAKMDLAVGFPLASAITGDGSVVGDVLPAGRYATLMYIGPMAGLGLMEANGALIDWAAKQGLAWDSRTALEGDHFGGRFESYLSDPNTEPNPDKWETEVAIRLKDE